MEERDTVRAEKVPENFKKVMAKKLLKSNKPDLPKFHLPVDHEAALLKD